MRPTMSAWPLADPPNFRTYSTRGVFEGGRPVLFVYHDAEDGAWQFHCDENPSASEAVLVCLEHAVGTDPALYELADLPLGWGAARAAPGAPWQRFPVPPDDAS